MAVPPTMTAAMAGSSSWLARIGEPLDKARRQHDAGDGRQHA